MDNRTLRLLQLTAEHFSSQRQQAYLVGGSLRNILLGEPCSDWDIVTGGDAPTLARQLADKLGGFYAYLHDKACRVIVPPLTAQKDDVEEGQEVIFDISSLKGNTLEYDLRQRDFTVNAIAAPLDEIVRSIELGELGIQEDGKGGYKRGAPLHFIDPLHGVGDIVARRLRAVDGEVFRHDPLRMLRAVRLMMRYTLEMDGWTEGLLMRDSSLLTQVAPERVRDELYAILAPDGARERLQFLDDHGLLTVLIPEFIPAREMSQPNPHHWDVLQHSLQTVGMWEKLVELLQQPVEEIRQSPLEHMKHVQQSQQSVDESRKSSLEHMKHVQQVQQSRQVRQTPDEIRESEIKNGEECNLVEIQALLREAEGQGIFSFAALSAPAMKLAVLLHDIGKPATRTVDEDGAVHFYGHPQTGVPLALQVMKRLKASTKDCRLVQQVTAHHMRPGQLGLSGPVTPRAVRRFFVDLGPTGIFVALFSLADHMATRGPMLGSDEEEGQGGSKAGSWRQHVEVVCGLLRDYIRNRERIMPPRLISAEELMKRLQLSPGPIVGELLEQIAEAQAEGVIHSKEEALWFAEEKLLRTK
ncbi:MAG: HD domain-containing protein [Chloroflexi bacterium]|nr:MAG: HD domain-containing protein [Chloroflexota bacterium]